MMEFLSNERNHCMFRLEICHLLNYSFCFYSAIGSTFVLELRASYTVFCTLYPGEPRGPGVRFYTPESPGANVVNGGGFPSAMAHCPAEVSICDDIWLRCQITGPFPGRLDSSSLVGAVDLCASTELT